MNPEFWKKRWLQGEIGWHQSEVEPAVVAWAADLKPTRIFVPLCGKSLDMAWLRARGHEVVGIELSLKACEEFFAENAIEFRRATEGDFEVFRAAGITIFNGDFFKLTPALLGQVGGVYDRAALIALPPELREKYMAHMKRLLTGSVSRAGFRFLQILLTRSPHDDGGPPFSVSVSEVEKCYAGFLDLKLLSAEKVEAKGPEGSVTTESVLSLPVNQDR